MTTLQASLIFKPLPPLFHFSSSSSKHVRSLSFSNPLSCLRLSTTASTPFKTRFCRHNLLLHCTLNPDQVDSSSEFALSDNDNSIEPHEFNEPQPSVVDISSVQNSFIDSNGGVVTSASDNEAAHVESEVMVENDELKKKLPIVVFLMGLFAKVKKGFENILLSDWFSWWPFWQQEKRLERLIADADANPNDAALQSALLAELNKHR